MKRILLSAFLLTVFVAIPITSRALPVNLGAAGPQNWALLEIGGGGIETDSENVSGAAAPPYGFINGNVGIANTASITTSAGNFPINGSVYLGSASTADAATAANATGGVIKNAASQTLLNQAFLNATAASTAAAALATSGGGVGKTSITAGGTIMPGVYNLTDLSLNNGAKLILSAGGSYVFNISGHLTLNSAQILLGSGLSKGNVLFNVTGTTGVAFSGGLFDPHGEAELQGIILAPDAAISITPGFVDGEIISGENINIASGGSINGGGLVPDGGSALLLMSLGLGALALARKQFVV